MRLTNFEISTVKQTVAEIDPSAEVYLYGSRTDDTKKGGDIDLLIISNIIDREKKRAVKFKLYDELGEQKIDILVAKPFSDDPFVKLAKSGGILL